MSPAYRVTKRGLDVLASILGLALLWPLFFLVAICIKATSPGPVFFRQERVGRRGVIFRIHKFRTMRVDSERHGQLTTAGDPRITRVGRFLRRTKADELPQLIDVFLGTMSLVGPRPEVPRFVALYPSDIRDIVLSVRPGITDWASIEFVDEDLVLAGAPDHHRAYVDLVLPVKLRQHVIYVQTASLWIDLRIILKTIARLVYRAAPPGNRYVGPGAAPEI